MTSTITPTLPGQEYGLNIPFEKADNARLFSNRKALVKHCASLCPQNPSIAEVGVYQGIFSQYLLNEFVPSKLHLIDTFCTSDNIYGYFTKNTHYKYIQQKFHDNQVVECHQGLSWDMLNSIADNSLDYIYIDADHSYQSVKKDIEAAYAKIKDGGIIQFNDYTHYGLLERGEYGVLFAVNEFIESKDIHLIGLSIDRSGYHDIAVRVIKNIPSDENQVKHVEFYIVTPCSRPENLEKMKELINFDLITKWYIIYDTRNQEFIKRYQHHDKIIELECKDEGIVGHQIRNLALNIITSGMMCFLDDDNVIHPEFWNILVEFKLGQIYTFDMIYKNQSILRGNNPVIGSIDTAQYVFDSSLVGNLRFNVSEYAADGYFIQDLVKQNKDKWVYVPKQAAYYNWIR